MVRAWYMDDDEVTDQHFEHHRNPPKFIDLDQLYKVSGVECITLNPETYETDGILDKIKKERGYTYEDEIVCSKTTLKNYDEQVKAFYTEHLHTDEEIRFVIEGSGYFDVRDKNEEWIRIEVVAGDLLVIPSGIYHRFTLDVKLFLRAKRLFAGEPVWLAYNRPVDDMECRKEYLERLENGLFKSL